MFKKYLTEDTIITIEEINIFIINYAKRKYIRY